MPLKDLVFSFSPKFIFLREVNVQRERVERVQRLLKYEGLYFVEGINNGGEITLLWKKKHMPG